MHIVKVILFFSSLAFFLESGCTTRPPASTLSQSTPGSTADRNYQHREADLNDRVRVLGEFFENGIRNGEWRHYDQRGRLISVETYRNDTLQGPAFYYFHENPKTPTRLQGNCEAGIRTGRWELWQSNRAVGPDGKGPWKMVVRYAYDATGRMRTRYQLHPNGQVALELSLSVSGVDTHYRKYSPSGKLIDEGEKLPVFLE